MTSVLQSPQTLAQELALRFTEPKDLPMRLQKQAKAENVCGADLPNSIVEIGFQENVKHWTKVVENLFARIDHKQAMRLAKIEPMQQKDTAGKQHPDLEVLLNYINLRMRIEFCKPDEYGRLSLLAKALQQAIDAQPALLG